MKGSLFFDMLNLSIFFIILIGLLTFILTIDFSPKIQKIPTEKVFAYYELTAINKTMIINIELKNKGETNVVLEPEISYNKNLIKLESKIDTIALKSNQTKNLTLKFSSINGVFCNEGKLEIVNISFINPINGKKLSLIAKYKIKEK